MGKVIDFIEDVFMPPVRVGRDFQSGGNNDDLYDVEPEDTEFVDKQLDKLRERGFSLGTALQIGGAILSAASRTRRPRRKKRTIPLPPIPPTLEKRGSVYSLKGMMPHSFFRIMSRAWNTSKIKYIFNKGTGVEFYEYFLIDVLRAVRFAYENGALRGNEPFRFKIVIDLLTKEVNKVQEQRSKEPKLDKKNLKNLKITLFKHQEPLIDFYNDVTAKFGLRGVIVSATMGSGKSQPLYSKILTPSGWKKMGDMKVGDLVLNPTAGINEVESIHPQGMCYPYEVEFSDGARTECNIDHLWKVRSGNKWEIKTLEEILDSGYLTGDLKPKYDVPLTRVHYPAKEQAIDPYLLGCLISTGQCSSARVYLHRAVHNESVAKRCRLNLPPNTVLDREVFKGDKGCTIVFDAKEFGTKCGLCEELEKLGLAQCLDDERFIPDRYLYGSWDQRVWLLRGMMDCIGEVVEGKGVIYRTPSMQLADDLITLVRSIGGLAYLSKSYDKRYGEVLEIKIVLAIINPFWTNELADKITPPNEEKVRKSIVAINRKPEKVEQQCLMLRGHSHIKDDNHMYITDGYVSTHNTILSLAMAETAKADIVIVIVPLPTVHKVWESTVKDIYKRKQEFWVSTDNSKPTSRTRFFIVHYEALTKFIKETLPRIRYKGKRVAIILDESHNLNEFKTLRTQKYLNLIDETKPYMVLPQSGTTLKAVASELMPSFTAIDEKFTEKVQKRFKKAFGGTNTYLTRLLQDRVKDLTYHVAKDEIGVPPPESVNILVKVPDGKKYTLPVIKAELTKYIEERKKFYAKTFKKDKEIFLKILDKAESEAKANNDSTWITNYRTYKQYLKLILGSTTYMDLHEEIKYVNKFEKNTLPHYLTKEEYAIFKALKSQVKYVELKVVGEALGNVLTKRRAEAHADMVLHADLGTYIKASLSKTVIFFNSIMVGDVLMDRLDEMGYKPVGVYGDTAKDLNKNVAKFKDKKDINPLVASFKTLGTGVPLTMASTAIIAELPFRDYLLQQAIARISRIGQPHPTTTIFLMLDTDDVPNISTRSKEIIQWAQEAVAEITGVSTTSAIGDINIENPTVEEKTMGWELL